MAVASTNVAVEVEHTGIGTTVFQHNLSTPNFIVLNLTLNIPIINFNLYQIIILILHDNLFKKIQSQSCINHAII